MAGCQLTPGSSKRSPDQRRAHCWSGRAAAVRSGARRASLRPANAAVTTCSAVLSRMSSARVAGDETAAQSAERQRPSSARSPATDRSSHLMATSSALAASARSSTPASTAGITVAARAKAKAATSPDPTRLPSLVRSSDRADADAAIAGCSFRTKAVTTTALALRTRADTNAGLGTVDDVRLASRQSQVCPEASRDPLGRGRFGAEYDGSVPLETDRRHWHLVENGRLPEVVRDQRLQRRVGVRALLLESTLNEVRTATGPQGDVGHSHDTQNPLSV
jgi:hypothetical protein